MQGKSIKFNVVPKIWLEKLYMKSTRANPKPQGHGANCQKPQKHASHTRMAASLDWRGARTGVARGWLSSLNIRLLKFILIDNAKRPQQTKFQLPNMFGSREIKSPKIANNLYRSMGDLISEVTSLIQIIGDFLRFYFSRTKYVWERNFGLWGSFYILNQCIHFFNLQK
jgi:hypothetical protein